MLTKPQIRIFGQFLKNVFAEYTYKALKEMSKEKSSDTFHSAIQKFKHEGLVNEKIIGKSKLYSVALSNETSYNYLAIAAIDRLNKQVKSTLQKLIAEIDKYTVFHSIAVFGSYSDGTQSKESDLDIAIIIESKKKEHEIKTAISSITKISLIELDCHVITKEEFLEMLKADYENLGKQIARKNLPIHNNYIFYAIIREGVENGFRH
ncbi:MAG TPA: nucleotidyltransferase domain-containing protein [Candidatus Nanoarchaeia archaeon]|nr:nucleotidyltransferase domain-containing protein [Candidatus Nanoarchaeia archaeon]